MVLPQPSPQPPSRTILVCQNRTCRKQGSDKVLAALQEKSPDGVVVVPSPCLGQCGSGPMVRVLPEEVWYSRVLPEEVGTIVDRHLRQNQPVAAMLYPKFHPKLARQ